MKKYLFAELKLSIINVMNFCEYPIEIINEILSYCTYDTLLEIQKTCKLIKMLVHDKMLIKKYVEKYGEFEYPPQLPPEPLQNEDNEHYKFIHIMCNKFDNMLYLNLINKNINIFDIYAKEGKLELLKIIKNEYPTIVCTLKGYYWAGKSKYTDLKHFINNFYPSLHKDFLCLRISMYLTGLNFMMYDEICKLNILGN